MEVLEWARSEVMRAASVELDSKMSARIFNAIFEANLRRLPGGTQQPLNDFSKVRDFLYSPVLLALLESPISLVMMVLLFLISPVLGWSALAFAVAQTLVAWLNERSTKPPLMQANRAAIEAHPMAHRIDMIQGSSIAPEVIAQVQAQAAGYERVVVILDSNHTHAHVLAELQAYAPLVSKGSYCVVFDTVIEDLPAGMYPDRPWDVGNNPKTAVREYLTQNPNFEVDEDMEAKLLITVAPGGYLRRR